MHASRLALLAAFRVALALVAAQYTTDQTNPPLIAIYTAHCKAQEPQQKCLTSLIIDQTECSHVS